MTYTALYRRFRPRLFADLVGQDHISRTLAAAIRQGSFVHAYLFCGPRGTGKTSTARIMARAVNCLNATPAGEPCGECEACIRSAKGEALDIMEIDAASNRGIDEIRDLRERVKYAPALEKYKVYIIDEAHMLTAPAFNALLKTLEEPPPRVIFILATTEPHKMPLTVLSRCQRFDFRRIGDDYLAAHLAQVASAEGYAATPEALALIARKVEGGMRDALGLLDQCAGFNGGHITVDALNKLTGNADAAFIAEMTRLLLAADAGELMGMVAKLHAQGHDLRQFLRDLLEYLRELLLTKLSPARESLPAWARTANANQLLKLMQSLSDGDGRLRVSLQPRLTLELALLSACSNIEAGGQKTTTSSQVTTPVAQATTPDTQATAPDTQEPVSDSQATASDGQAAAPDTQEPASDGQAAAPDAQDLISDSQATVLSSQETASDSQTTVSDTQVTTSDSQVTVSNSQVNISDGQATVSDSQMNATSEAKKRKKTPRPAKPQTKPQTPSDSLHQESKSSAGSAVPQTAEKSGAREEEAVDAEGDVARIKEIWPQIIQAVRRDNPGIAAFLDKVKPLTLRRDRLTLIFEAEYALFMDKLCCPGAARDLLEQKIALLYGQKLSIEGLLAQAATASAKATPEEEQGSLF
ncbi:MAG: DNA polymerase III subunit gamma/tau [Clostridiales bacterium]|nr:DNA polymerase III subunit gamma/tau [Clostridiales bacterium]